MQAYYCVQFSINGKNKTIIRSTTDKDFAESAHRRAKYLIDQAKKNGIDPVNHLDENMELDRIKASTIWFRSGNNFLSWLYLHDLPEFHCLGKMLLDIGYTAVSKNKTMLKTLVKADRLYSKTSKDQCFIYPVDDVVIDGHSFYFNVPAKVLTALSGPDGKHQEEDAFIMVNDMRISDDNLFKYFSKKPIKRRAR